jgi:hypothetical protein
VVAVAAGAFYLDVTPPTAAGLYQVFVFAKRVAPLGFSDDLIKCAVVVDEVGAMAPERLRP